MSDAVVVRRAESRDAEELARLATQLGYASSAADVESRLGSLASSATDAVLVAEIGDAIAGFMHLSIIITVTSAPFVEIAALVVDDRARGTGLGTQLVDAASSFARARGIERVRVRSNVVRTQTREFYVKRGFTVVKTQNVFDKVL